MRSCDGLIHRYPDRVLLKLVQVCAVYCRFCFRRETVGPAGAGTLSADALDAALAYIRARPEIWEVIVSGGDPFVAGPRRLAALVAALAEIPHVKVLRFHTRVPVVAPDRVTPELVAALKAPGMATWVAIHANHPRELTPAARAALARLADAGIALVSQTVLLRGRQRRRGDAGGADARFRRMPGEAVLPPPWRPGAGHSAFPHDDRQGPGADAGAPRPHLGAVPADLRPRHPRRPRQIADRAELPYKHR